jgi:Protein of unknown function (DUF4013)
MGSQPTARVWPTCPLIVRLGAMNSVGEAFGWAFRDPSWLGKVAVQGLILIIPIVGWIAAIGWLMLAFENARSGRDELPAAGFHLGRGIGLFGVVIIYSIVIDIPAWILDFSGAHFAQVCYGDTCSQQFVQGPLSGFGNLWSFLAQLVIYFITPALIVTVYHRGFGGAFNVGAVWQLATSKASNSVIGGLVIFVAGIIGALGIIACCIGVFFTIIYSLSIEAAVAAWFERQAAAPPAPAIPAA